MKVLVIDDSKTIAFGLKMQLEREGLEVGIASTITDIAREVDGDYDIIVLDVNMPVVGGETVREKLIAWGWTKGIIFYSSESKEKLEDLVKKNGGCYVEKAADVYKLLKRIESCCDGSCAGSRCEWMGK